MERGTLGGVGGGRHTERCWWREGQWDLLGGRNWPCLVGGENFKSSKIIATCKTGFSKYISTLL